MKLRTTLKTLVRSPLKSALTLLLLTATTFAFVSRGVEYVATVQQIRAAEASYFATGTVEMTLSAYEDAMYQRLGEDVFTLENGGYLGRTSRAILPMDSAVADTILSSEYIENSEVRLVSGGTHRDYWSVLEQPLSDLKDYGVRYYGISEGENRSEGTFDMYNYMFVGELCDKIEPDSRSLSTYTRQLLVSYPERVPISRADAVDEKDGAVFHLVDDMFTAVEMRWYVPENYTNRAFWETLSEQSLVGDYFVLSLAMKNEGSLRLYKDLLPCVDYPIINLSYIEREYSVTDLETILQDPGAYGTPRYTCPPAEHLVDGYLNKIDHGYGIPLVKEGQEPVRVADYYATVDRNLHTSEVVYTSDMNMIHKFKSGDMFIAAGRALEENEQSEVCVIGADFAELNGLSVGDMLTLDLCADTMIHSGKVFGRETPYPTDRDVVSENQLTERGLPNVTKSFEIVGIWSDAAFDVEDPYTYALNTIFVPESCYPWAGQVEPSLLPSTFSFELKHPGDAALLKAEIGDQLAALGYELKINDGGYAAAKPNLDFMRLSALIGFVAMCVGLLLCLVLITYLFIIRKKKDYAIMRALGTTKFRSNKALLSALLVLSLCSVAIGGTAGGVVAQETAVQVAAEVSEVTGVVAETANSWTLVSAFAFGTVALVMLFGICGLVKIARAPPLALLQGK